MTEFMPKTAESWVSSQIGSSTCRARPVNQSSVPLFAETTRGNSSVAQTGNISYHVLGDGMRDLA